jgi:type IV secretory pathway VirD2 relaxase
MVDETSFTPRLGKLRDVGAGSSKRFRARVLKAAKGLNRKATRSAFTGARIGRGGAAGLHAQSRAQRMDRFRMRRVVVKVHIARARAGIGVRAYARHLDYIQRDGVDREGLGGELYGHEGELVDGRDFAERSLGDRHQFRVIVSPEDAGEIGDLRTTTQRLMSDMERDLGTRLDWVAVDHHNTGHSHTHIVIRGKDALGHDLVIARDYLMKGLRARAEEGLTQELGPRRDIEIARARFQEVSKDRFTGIDRNLAAMENEGHIKLVPGAGAQARFVSSLQRQRLSHLEGLHLSQQTRSDTWRMKPDWQRALKAMGRRGDIIRALSAGVEHGPHLTKVRFFDERAGDAPVLRGSVIQNGPEDELTDKRFVLVQDFSGTPWHVPASEDLGGAMPPKGAIVEVARIEAAPRRADHVIAKIAEQNGGVYSDALHAASDPSASGAYRLAHKRRLEALRRAGSVTRSKDGVWQIGERYLEQAADFEAARGGGHRIQVRSWMAMEDQIEARAETWLDQVDKAKIDKDDVRLLEARRLRLSFLRQEGLLGEGQDGLSHEALKRLRLDEMRRAAAGETRRSGRTYATLETGEKLQGGFERTTDLAQGRMAIIGTQKEFALVPWRPDLERHRGRSLTVERNTRGVSWSFPSIWSRGLSR